MLKQECRVGCFVTHKVKAVVKQFIPQRIKVCVAFQDQCRPITVTDDHQTFIRDVHQG